MTERIRILIADDHAVVRKGLHGFIDTQPDMEVVGEAPNGLEAVRLAQALAPDVILMDLVMPRLSGLEAIVQVKQTHPDVRILVLTSFVEEAQVFAAIKAGALGYLLKDSSPEDLVRGIRDVYQGLPSLHPLVAQKLMTEVVWRPDQAPTPDALTDREAEVLEHLARGLANQDIAETLGISVHTVRKHVSNILAKLHLANRTQATLYARQHPPISD